LKAFVKQSMATIVVDEVDANAGLRRRGKSVQPACLNETRELAAR